MLQKWIKPLKIPVSTFYIITFINCSLTSQRSMIWSWVTTRTQTINPGIGAHAHVLSPLSAGHWGISLNQVSSTGFTWIELQCAPSSSLPRVWWGSTDNTTNYHSWKHTGRCLVLYWENTQTATEESPGWLPTARHWPGRQWNPHLYIHPHKSLLFHGALKVIWDQLFDRNCTSLCTWHYF